MKQPLMMSFNDNVPGIISQKIGWKNCLLRFLDQMLGQVILVVQGDAVISSMP